MNAGAPQFIPEPTADRLRAQDPAAFEWLVQRTQRIVMGLAQSIGLRGADLDDGAAETFLAVYKALPGYRGDSAVTTWVYRVACRTLVRVRKRLRRKPLWWLVGGPAADAAPERRAVENERAGEIWDAVAALEPRSAMAVELFYRRELPVDEIAVMLDCPANTVKTLLHRARATLKQRLSPEALT